MIDVASTGQQVLSQPLDIVYSFRQVMNAVASSGNVDAVLESVLDACAERLGYLYPCAALLDIREGRLVGRVVSSPRIWESFREATRKAGLQLDSILGYRSERRSAPRGTTGNDEVPPDALCYRPDPHGNLVVRVFLNRSPHVTTRFYDLVESQLDPHLADSVEQALGIESIALVPLVTGGRCLGSLVAGFPKARPITDLDLLLLDLFASLAALALENARLHQVLQEREQQELAGHSGGGGAVEA